MARDEHIAWLTDVALEMAGELGRQDVLIEILEARLRLDSTNSHRPPSTDPPSVEKPKREPTGRKPGGQFGHPGKTRPLVPPERVDETKEIYPGECGKCGAALSKEPACEPIRHQHAEIPEIHPHVTEHRLHACRCERCGAVTRAGLPEGVPSGAFGPRLTAIVVLLRSAYRMSLRNVEQFLSDAFGVEISLGSLKNIEDRVSEVVAPAVEEVRQAVKGADVVHADETSYREKGKRVYLWAAVTGFAAVFLIRSRRTAKVAKELLGDAFRIVVTDRFAGYAWIPVWCRQVCLAHLRRDARKMEMRGGVAGVHGGPEGQ